MKAFEKGLREGDYRSHCLVSVGDVERPPRRPLKTLFQQPSHTFDELEQNCAGIFQKQRFGLMITRFETVDPSIWSPITAFLADARRRIDFPVPRAFLDLFYGNYLSNFTGLHRDTQEIFAFVVRGKKRILAWPSEYFLGKLKGLGPGARYFHMRLPLDHRKYRRDAVTLDARPGDIIYWPSDYWHVAEAQDASFSAMISLGVIRQDCAPKLNQEQERFRERLTVGSAVPSQNMTDLMPEKNAGRRLRWVTGFGFELGGPMDHARPGRSLGNVTVVKKKHSLLLWKVDRERRQIIVSTNGHSIALPRSRRIETFLNRLSTGESVPVSHSLQRARGDGGSPIFETNWNKRCQLRTRKLTGKRDLRVSLIDWLLRVYAVERT
ncbi:MAG: hypothetical protein HYR96_08235 [Deltaproteobacteria bacterium]|nr:hypothetical protein [Deltaproteobacteria bacterium]